MREGLKIHRAQSVFCAGRKKIALLGEERACGQETEELSP